MEQNLIRSVDLEVLDLSCSLIPSLPKNSDFKFELFSNYEDAKQIFRASLKQYKESQTTYTLEEFASEHIELIKDLVGLYSHCLVLETGKNKNYFNF